MDRLRDHRGRFMKRPTFNFFGLPIEIRLMIYARYLSHEEVSLAVGIWSWMPSRYQPHLVKKLPLLRTSRIVLAEAMTIFYRSYCFWIRVPRWVIRIPPFQTQIPRSEDMRSLTPVLSRITKMRLIDKVPARRREWDENLPPCIQGLLDHCPRLRILRLDILKSPARRGQIFGKPHCLPKTASSLAELWKRLDRLEISVVHLGDIREVIRRGNPGEFIYYGDTSAGFRELIAPKHCWIRHSSVQLQSYYYWRTIWLLKRTTKSSTQSEQGEPEIV